MAQSVVLWGATYSNVPALEVPKSGGGKARFDDTSDANALASELNAGSSAYVNGVKINGEQVIQHYYTGTGAPPASLGEDGDIYLEVVN